MAESRGEALGRRREDEPQHRQQQKNDQGTTGGGQNCTLGAGTIARHGFAALAALAAPAALAEGGVNPARVNTARPAGDWTQSTQARARRGCAASAITAIGYSAITFISGGIATTPTALPAALASVR